jgi:hypothetical protein
MPQTPSCAGKRFGHNFAMPGGPCLNGCGMTQAHLSASAQPLPKRVQKKPTFRAPPGRPLIWGMHSSLHDVARLISEWCGEPKEFAMYLGRAKDMGEQRAWAIWSELKQSRTPIRNRAALFMARSRTISKKHALTSNRKRV